MNSSPMGIQSVSLEGRADKSSEFIEYAPSDVDELVKIVLASKHADYVSTSLVADELEEKEHRDEGPLIRTLEYELVDAAAGSISARRDHLAALVFVLEDGCVLKDSSGLARTRPCSDDLMTDSLVRAVGDNVLASVRAKFESENANASLSQKLYLDVFGIGKDAEVASLKKLATISRSILEELSQGKKTILGEYETALVGTTKEDLIESKNGLNDDLSKKIQEREGYTEDRTALEVELENLDVTFEGLFASAGISEDLPDFELITDGDITKINPDSIFEGIKQSYYRKAKREKDENITRTEEEAFQLARERIEGLLQLKKDDFAKYSKKEQEARDDVQRLNEELTSFQAAETAAQAEFDREDAILTGFETTKNNVDTAITSFDEIVTNDVPEQHYIDDVGAVVSVTTLQTKINNLNFALGEKSTASTNRETAGRLKSNANTNKGKADDEWTAAKRKTSQAWRDYENTSSKIGQGKDERDNPEKSSKYSDYLLCCFVESVAEKKYNAAVKVYNDACSDYDAADDIYDAKETAVENKRTEKKTEEQNVSKNIDTAESNAAEDYNGQELTVLDLGKVLSTAKNAASNAWTARDTNNTNITAYETKKEDARNSAEALQKQLDDLLDGHLPGSDSPEGEGEEEKEEEEEEGMDGTASLEQLLKDREKLRERIEDLNGPIAECEAEEMRIGQEIKLIDDQLSGTMEVEENRRREAEYVRAKRTREQLVQTALQLQCVVTAAGYEMFGTWSGEKMENTAIRLMRTLIADIKGMATTVKFGTEPPSGPLEQLAGSEHRVMDVESIERLITKLYNPEEHGAAPDPISKVESTVSSEFQEDDDLKKLRVVLINEVDGETEELAEQAIKKPLETRSYPLLFRCPELFDIEKADEQWTVLRSISRTSSRPLEHYMELIATSMNTSWALDESATYLMTSWTKHKSLKLASIEELGTLISKVEDLQQDTIQSRKAFDVFRVAPPSKGFVMTASSVGLEASQWAMESMLKLLDLVISTEQEMVGADQLEIVSILKSVTKSYDKIRRRLLDRSIKVLQAEIQKRKRAILSGDAENIGGSAGTDGASLEEQISEQEIAIEQANAQLEQMNSKKQALETHASYTNSSLEKHQAALRKLLEDLESDLITKQDELEKKKKEYEETENEIRESLDDIEKLRDELKVLEGQAEELQGKLDNVGKALEDLEEDQIQVNGEIDIINLKISHLEDSKKQSEDRILFLEMWGTFMSDLHSNLTDNADGIARRSKFSEDYKALGPNPSHEDTYRLIGEHYPSLKETLDHVALIDSWSARLDLRKALNQQLVQYPKIDYEPETQSSAGILSLHGTSLTFQEVEDKLFEFVSERCRQVGLTFDSRGLLSAESATSLSGGLGSNSIPVPIREIIHDRIRRYYHPSTNSGKARWDEQINMRDRDAEQVLERMKSHCGITKWDVVSAYASTVEVVVGNSFVVEQPAELPGLNFFVTAGRNIWVLENCSIDTSPKQTAELRSLKARNGSDYRSGSRANGRAGDDGLHAPAGQNAGHVTMNAYEKFQYIGTRLSISSAGAVGARGQNGGNGDEGRPGTSGSSLTPYDTNGMGDWQVSYAFTRVPGCDQDESLSTKPSRQQELSGRGGDGGRPGAGGQGGSGGEFVVMDKENETVHMHPSIDGLSVAQDATFGDCLVVATLKYGKDGEHSTQGGRGGKGGTPGQKAAETVMNKYSFFRKTVTKHGFIRKDFNTGLCKHTDKVPSWHKTQHTVESGRKLHCNYSCYDRTDFDNGKYPFLKGSEEEAAKYSENSRGSSGAAGGKGDEQEEESMNALQQKRKENVNISTTSQYQSKKYQEIEILKEEDEFAKLGELYDLEQEQLTEELSSLTEQIQMKKEELIKLQQTANELTEQIEGASKEKEELESNMETINDAIDKQVEEISAEEKDALSKIMANVQLSTEISDLQTEVENIGIDKKYTVQTMAELESVASQIRQRHASELAALVRDRQELQEHITRLQLQLLQMHSEKSQLGGLSGLSDLDALLMRAEQVQKRETVQQEKTMEVQVEATLSDDQVDQLGLQMVKLTKRDTFSYDGGKHSIWPDLIKHPEAATSVRQILDAVPKMAQDLREVTVERLEVILRFCIYRERLNEIANLTGLGDPEKVHDIVNGKLEELRTDLQDDHWFIGSLTGMTLLMTSEEDFRVDEASLTTRYESVKGIEISNSLSPIEYEALKLLIEMKETGPSLQHIAQFINMYTPLINDASTLRSRGYLNILQGGPVRVLDKFSRIVLTYLRKTDDALATHNLDLAIGIAERINETADALVATVLEFALRRRRDFRGGTAYTWLLIRNAEKAKPLLLSGQADQALLEMRNTGTSSAGPTVYGPRTHDELRKLISSVSLCTTPEEVAFKLATVARSMAGGFTTSTAEETTHVLSALRGMSFGEGEGVEARRAAAVSPLTTCASVGLNRLALLHSQGNRKWEFLLRSTAMTRLMLADISIEERLSRVLAFFEFVEAELSAKLEIAEEIELPEDEVKRAIFFSALSTASEVTFAAETESNVEFLRTLGFSEEGYELACERALYAMIIPRPGLNGSVEIEGDIHAPLLDAVLKAKFSDAPLVSQLLPTALETRQQQTERALLRASKEANETEKLLSLEDIKNIVQPSFADVTEKESAQQSANELVQTFFFQLSSEATQHLWATSSGEDRRYLIMMVVAMLRSDEHASSQKLQDQMEGVTFLWRNWQSAGENFDAARAVLEDGTKSIVRAVVASAVSLLEERSTKHLPYIEDTLETALSIMGWWVLEKDVPDSSSTDDFAMYAVCLEVLSRVHGLVLANYDRKKELSHSTALEDLQSSYESADYNLVRRLLSVNVAFAAGGVDTEHIYQELEKAVSSELPSGDEEAAEQCRRLHEVILGGAEASQHPMARGTYLNLISHAGCKRNSLVETSEAVDVAMSLIDSWRTRKNVNCRTIGLMILHTVALEIRDIERQEVTAKFVIHADEEQKLTQEAKKSLAQSTASLGESSPALIAENKRRQELWQVYFHQIRDELERQAEESPVTWEEISQRLSKTVENGDDFEYQLAKNANLLIFSRRVKDTPHEEDMPEALRKETRSAWVEKRWEQLSEAIDVANFEGVTTTSFNGNTQMTRLIAALAGLIPLIEDYKEDETVEVSVERCDVIGWILDGLAISHETMTLEARSEDNLIGKLTTTVTDLSQSVMYIRASAKLIEGGRRLCTVLEMFNQSAGRYARVKDFAEACYNDSELKCRIGNIDDSCALSTEVFVQAADHGDTAIDSNKTTLHEFAYEVRAAKAFGNLPQKYSERLHQDIDCGTSHPAEYEDALKFLLSMRYPSDSDAFTTFDELSRIARLVGATDPHEQSLLEVAYKSQLSRLGGMLHFNLGMAYESEMNPSLGSAEQKSSTKQEYNAAAEAGVDAAYNNLLCNSFFEARNQYMTLDMARAAVEPSFEKIKGREPKAALNLALLSESKNPTKKYSFKPFTSVTEDKSEVFSDFNQILRKMVKLLEDTAAKASEKSKPGLLFAHMFDGKMDKLVAHLLQTQGEIGLDELSEHMRTSLNEIIAAIKTSSPFVDVGGFQTALQNMYDGIQLEAVEEYGPFLTVLPDIEEVSKVLFRSRGATILANKVSMLDDNVCATMGGLLHEVVENRIHEMSSPTEVSARSSRAAILRRMSDLAAKHLNQMREEQEAEARETLRATAERIVDAILFEDEDPMRVGEVEISSLWSDSEAEMADIIGIENAKEATQDSAPLEWDQKLSKETLLNLLNRQSSAEIDEALKNLENSFSSNSVIPGQDPGKDLQLVVDELQKIRDARAEIFCAQNIDNLVVMEKQYQNIFNAAHHILYLTTKTYVIKTRGPAKPARTEDPVKLKAYTRAVAKMAEQASRTVKSVKAQADKVIDLFDMVRVSHDRLLGLEFVYSDKKSSAYHLTSDLLAQPGVNTLSSSSVLWLLQAEDQEYGKSCLERALSSAAERTSNPSLHETAHAAAFEMLRMQVERLLDLIGEQDRRGEALSQVQTLGLQNLNSSGGIKLVQLMVGTSCMMVHEGSKDKSTLAASREEIFGLVKSIALVVESQAWRSIELINRLELYRSPSRWVPILEGYHICMALSYCPESTTDADKEMFEKSATSILRIGTSRGEHVMKDFISCLQLLVASHADATTLCVIADCVARRRWPFTSSHKVHYVAAAKLTSGEDMIAHLQDVAKRQRENSQDRTFARLAEIMREDIDGVNASVSSMLKFHSENPQMTVLEQRATTIHNIAKTHKSPDGKLIKDWKKDDILNWAREFKQHSADYFDGYHTDKINEMLAVFTRVVQKVKDYDVRNPQLLALILFVDGMIEDKARLGEIGTGEGKSLITVLSGIARVFKGDTVDIISSSRVLAERDALEALDWCSYFDIGVTNNCDDDAAADEDLRMQRYRDHPMIYGDTGSFQRDILLSKYYGRSIREKLASSLVVDEVDSLFIDSISNTLYISHDIQDLRNLEDILVSIWMAVHGSDVINYSESSVRLVMTFIHKQIDRDVLFVPRWLRDFVEERLEIWIRNAYSAKSMQCGNQYTLYETGLKRGQAVVVDLYTGLEMPSTQWSNGLHQFIQLKHLNKMSPESLKAIFIANVNYVTTYGSKITGMSGTLGSQPEIDLLEHVYSAESFRMPRFKEELYFEESAVVTSSRARWLELLCDEVIEQSQASTGYDSAATESYMVKQQEKLEKAQRKLELEQSTLKSLQLAIEEVRENDAAHQALRVEYAMPASVDEDAVREIREFTIELKKSEPIEKGDEEQGLDRLDTVLTHVAVLEAHFASVRDGQARIDDLERQISEKEIDVMKLQLSGDIQGLPEEEEALQKLKDTRCKEVSDLIQLKDTKEGKCKELIQANSLAQVGCSSVHLSYINDREEERKKSAEKVKQYQAEVVERQIKLESAEESIADGKGGRAVLVICRNKNDCVALRNSLVNRGELKKLYEYTGNTEKITEIDPQTGKVLQTHVPLERLKPHDVIVATNIAGRGTSLKTTDVIEQCGGLHVVLGYVPDNIRVEQQAWGRTSRHGQSGSGRFIVADPRAATSLEDVNLDYLISERDLKEADRLEEIEVRSIPRLDLQNELFRRFAEISESLKEKFSEAVDKDLQEKELRDQWAFFLEKHNETLENCYERPEAAKRELLAALEDFEEDQADKLAKSPFGLVQSPGNLLKVVSEALVREDYHLAKTASQSIIDADKQFAMYGYYYHALSLFGSGTSSLQHKQQALEELEKAAYLMRRKSDQLQGNSQISSSISSMEQDAGKGTGSNFFTHTNSNTQSLLHIHLYAAERYTGRALTEANFETSVINGDSTKKVYDIINDEKELRKFMRPLRVSTEIEIRLRVYGPDAKAVEFLTRPRKGDQEACQWQDGDLEVGNVTDEDIETLKESDLAWELVLFRFGNEFEHSDKFQVHFPDSIHYALPYILENVRKLAQDDSGKPIPFAHVPENQRAEVREIFFSPLLLEEEIVKLLKSITTSETPVEYLVPVSDHREKSYGLWDGVGFHGIGTQLKEWFLEEAASNRPILEEDARTEVSRLYREKHGKDPTSEETTMVIESMLSFGVAEVKLLIAIEEESLSTIRADSGIIDLKPTTTPEDIDRIEFTGITMLEKFEKEIRGIMKEKIGSVLLTEDIDKIMEGEDEYNLDNVNTFLLLQGLARAHGVANYLCDRLGMKDIVEYKKETVDFLLEGLDETFDMGESVKISTAAELQGILILERVLDLPRAQIGINCDQDLKSLVADIKKHCRAEVDAVAKTTLIGDESLEEKTKAMLDDMAEAIEGSVSDLVELQGKLKVDLEALPDLMSTEQIPPELVNFIEAGAEQTFKLVKKKTFADYWDWNAFAVAMIGVVQVVAGATIMALTFGAGTHFAGALISEGIGDMIYATTAGLTGTFSWKEYGIQKGISLSITIGTAALSAGVSTLAWRATQTATKLATKVTASIVVKAVAKKVAYETVKGGIDAGVGFGVDKLSEMTTEHVFNIFTDNLRVRADNDYRCQQSVAQIAGTLKTLMPKLGATKLQTMFEDAVKDSVENSSMTEQKERITDAVMECGERVSAELEHASTRLKSTGNKYAKILGNMSSIVAKTMTGAGVIHSVVEVVSIVPEIYDRINQRLLSISGGGQNPSDVLTGSDLEKWTDERMDFANEEVLTAVEGIVAEGIASPMFGEVISIGTNKVLGPMSYVMERDYKELQRKSIAGGELQRLSGKFEPLTEAERRQITYLTNIIDKKKDKFSTVLSDVDALNSADNIVWLNGKEVRIGDVTDIVGSKGLKTMRSNSRGGTPYLVRPKYDHYISELSIVKPANKFDLEVMARTAEMHISLTCTTEGVTENVTIPDLLSSELGKSVKMKLVKDLDIPEGRYLLIGDNGEILYENEFTPVGSASAAQILLYKRTFDETNDHEKAMKAANSESEVRKFIEDAQKVAWMSPDLQKLYFAAEHEQAAHILGGGFRKPLPVVPSPNELPKLKRAPRRRLKRRAPQPPTQTPVTEILLGRAVKLEGAEPAKTLPREDRPEKPVIKKVRLVATYSFIQDILDAAEEEKEKNAPLYIPESSPKMRAAANNPCKPRISSEEMERIEKILREEHLYSTRTDLSSLLKFYVSRGEDRVSSANPKTFKAAANGGTAKEAATVRSENSIHFIQYEFVDCSANISAV